MNKYTAIPTEYRGVRYRSKSEAMFARYLDLRIQDEHLEPFGLVGFQYEPSELIAVGGWTPDFLAWSVFQWPGDFPKLYFDFIEYKPKRPTKAYVATFYRRCLEWTKANPEKKPSVSFSIYWGNIFDEERGTIESTTIGNDEITYMDEEHNWLPHSYIDDIKATRFDLEGCHES